MQIPATMFIERTVFEQFLDYTFCHSNLEWGGLLIGRKVGNDLYCVAAVLPPQKTQSLGYCEFKRNIFPVIRQVLDQIDEQFHDNNFFITTWIHTHPDFGVFLSKTDDETFTYLTKLNPMITAIVVDPVRYEWIAVNSKPGNLHGFTPVELQLNYLVDLKHPDGDLLKKLRLIQQNSNSPLSRKLFQLEESEKIEVFIPISLDSLKHNLILSNLRHLEGQMREVKEKIFAQESSEILIPKSKEENPEIQKIVDYTTFLRSLGKEVKQWQSLSLNRKLCEYDLEEFMKAYGSSQVEQVIHYMESLVEILPVQMAVQISVWEDFIQYPMKNKLYLIKWSSIKEIGFETFDEKNFLFVITLKKKFPAKRKGLLIFNPKIEKLLEALRSKATIAVSNEMHDFSQNYMKKMKERKEKETQKLKKKEAHAAKKLVKNKIQKAKEEEKKKAESTKIAQEKIENINNTQEQPEKQPPVEKSDKPGEPAKRDAG